MQPKPQGAGRWVLDSAENAWRVALSVTVPGGVAEVVPGVGDSDWMGLGMPPAGDRRMEADTPFIIARA